jgi:subtilisin family serine protease
VIAVAATDSMDNRALFSSTGPAVMLAAPGVNILSTYKDGYASLSGTSMACPHVAGTAALISAINPSFTNGNIRDRLTQTATDLGTPGRDNLYGYGLVNAETAAAVSSPDEPAPKIHVENIQVTTSSRSLGKNTLVSATAVVTIHDNAGQPVKGANVSGHWSGATADTDSAITGADGTVSVKSNEVKYKNGVLTFTFTVDNVSHVIAWDKIVKSGKGTYP